MSAQHTPGPWTLDKSRMVLGPCFTGELKAICELVRGGSPQQSDANARLIAAAPDLLDLALGVVTAIEGNMMAWPSGVEKHLLEGARAAIAKAGGAQ